MNVTVIDGHGGMLGAQLVKEILSRFPDLSVCAVGTNAIATGAMLKAGAKNVATGENPVIVAARKANVIIGPIGIVIADSLFGEITPPMALAVGSANAVRILIPMNKCENLVAGVRDENVASLVSDAMAKLESVLNSARN